MLEELLYPPVCVACGVLLRGPSPLPACSRCGPEIVPLAPSDRVAGNLEALYAYEGPLALAMKRLKAGGDLALAGPLGRLLGQAEALHRPPATAFDIVTTVPTRGVHLWRRGYDHLLPLARHALHEAYRGAARGRDTPLFRPSLLGRTRPAPAQTGLSREQRHDNVRGLFVVAAPDGPTLLRDRRALVLDDVTTTGSTLRACLEALVAAGVREAHGLALLRTESGAP